MRVFYWTHRNIYFQLAQSIIYILQVKWQQNFAPVIEWFLNKKKGIFFLISYHRENGLTWMCCFRKFTRKMVKRNTFMKNIFSACCICVSVWNLWCVSTIRIVFSKRHIFQKPNWFFSLLFSLVVWRVIATVWNPGESKYIRIYETTIEHINDNTVIQNVSLSKLRYLVLFSAYISFFILFFWFTSCTFWLFTT